MVIMGTGKSVNFNIVTKLNRITPVQSIKYIYIYIYTAIYQTNIKIRQSKYSCASKNHQYTIVFHLTTCSAGLLAIYVSLVAYLPAVRRRYYSTRNMTPIFHTLKVIFSSSYVHTGVVGKSVRGILCPGDTLS